MHCFSSVERSLARWQLAIGLAWLAGCAPGHTGRCESGPEIGASCADGCSNDGDALVDCDDPDCASEPSCAVDCADGRTACVDDCVDLRTSPSHCGRCDAACSPGTICTSGSCAPLPECPAEGCPLGSICDLASDHCVAGCTGDAGCPSGQICESRSCVDGCRDDAACGSGRICDAMMCRIGCRSDGECGSDRICEATTCRAGCRAHEDCAPDEVCSGSTCAAGCRSDGDCAGGQICDSLACRAGCRLDADCGAGATCVASALACASCPTDPGEPGPVTADESPTEVRSAGATDETVTRVLCGTSDRDAVRWANDLTGWNGRELSYDEVITVEIAGAEPGATTEVELQLHDGRSEDVQTIAGNGLVTLRDVSSGYACTLVRPPGRCGDGHGYQVHIGTSSGTPVTATVHLRFDVR
jgi:hypothetical protein